VGCQLTGHKSYAEAHPTLAGGVLSSHFTPRFARHGSSSAVSRLKKPVFRLIFQDLLFLSGCGQYLHRAASSGGGLWLSRADRLMWLPEQLQLALSWECTSVCKVGREGIGRDLVDTQTRHSLKANSFAEATATGVNWLSLHKSGVVRGVIVAAAVLVVVVGSLVAYSVRSSQANVALGAALDVYNAPLAEPGFPAESGAYATAADRAKAANQKFTEVASTYSPLPVANKAHYFAGITAEQLGQNGTAESELKTASGALDRNVANLARLALAGLYQKTSRESQAVEQYNAIIAKPSETVTASVAQLSLADLYAAQGKQDQARQIWAKVKDADKEGAAGSIATEKLGAQQ
jgi:tetratricopeptide (TPR) repeat protein